MKLSQKVKTSREKGKYIMVKCATPFKRTTGI
jgi:hypothetical protein